MSKPGTKSIVWQYVGLKLGVNGEVSDDGTVLRCSCQVVVVQKKRGEKWKELMEAVVAKDGLAR